jgi:drug/metabolite transporter (DMT)-like permease
VRYYLGYLAAVPLVALGVWAGYGMLETAFGEALCEYSCRETNRPETFMAVAMGAFIAAVIAGVYGWRRERREAAPEHRPGLGYGLLLLGCIPVVGLFLGIAVLEGTDLWLIRN